MCVYAFSKETGHGGGREGKRWGRGEGKGYN